MCMYAIFFFPNYIINLDYFIVDTIMSPNINASQQREKLSITYLRPEENQWKQKTKNKKQTNKNSSTLLMFCVIIRVKLKV